MTGPGSLVSGVLNFRDTGGLSAGAGRTRHGVLYRSGNLVDVDEEGMRQLQALGLRRVVDLRDDAEVLEAPSRLPGGVPTTRVPLFAGSVESFFIAGTTLPELYSGILRDCSDRVVEVVRAVVAEQPVLVHCTIGKDRTGITVAIALAAAGVDREAVIADYARTEALLPAERNARVVASIRRAVPNAATAEELATRSPAPVMAGLLDAVAARYGDASDYLRAHGLGDDELRALRSALLE